MRVFENGIIKEEDFAKDYEFIEKELAELDTKKLKHLVLIKKHLILYIYQLKEIQKEKN